MVYTVGGGMGKVLATGGAHPRREMARAERPSAPIAAFLAVSNLVLVTKVCMWPRRPGVFRGLTGCLPGRCSGRKAGFL